MEFNKLPLAVVWIVDDVDHAAPFHAPNDIPGLLTRHSEPWRYILYLQSVSGFSEEEGLNVVLVLFCDGGCPLSEGRGRGLQGGDTLAICGPLPSVKAFMGVKAGFQFGDALILLSVLLSEFGDLLFHRGQLAEYLHQQGPG